MKVKCEKHFSLTQRKRVIRKGHTSAAAVLPAGIGGVRSPLAVVQLRGSSAFWLLRNFIYSRYDPAAVLLVLIVSVLA